MLGKKVSEPESRGQQQRDRSEVSQPSQPAATQLSDLIPTHCKCFGGQVTLYQYLSTQLQRVLQVCNRSNLGAHLLENLLEKSYAPVAAIEVALGLTPHY